MPARDGEDTKKQTRLRTSGPPPTHPEDRQRPPPTHPEDRQQFFPKGFPLKDYLAQPSWDGRLVCLKFCAGLQCNYGDQCRYSHSLPASIAQDKGVWQHNAEVLRLIASGVLSEADAAWHFLAPPDGSTSSDPPSLVVDAAGQTWHAVFPPLEGLEGLTWDIPAEDLAEDPSITSTRR